MSEINPDPERIKILKILQDYRGLVLREDKFDEADYTRMDGIEEHFIQLQSDRERLRGALEQIAHPIKHLQKEADKNGSNFNPVTALQLAGDALYLREIAQKTLKETEI